ncbi:MAG: hypothetical protein M1453_02810 [Acidobacteria bacterium]|nr:hypothetical protein [Acidobacteriota bacterium]MCL5286911.1 hypothetical protein [Acidobacteriota bacterium]
MSLLTGLIFCIFLCAVPGMIAERKGRNAVICVVATVLLAVLFSWDWIAYERNGGDVINAIENTVRTVPRPSPYPLGPWPYFIGASAMVSIITALLPSHRHGPTPQSSSSQTPNT